jgi:hypothetical protein
MIFAAYQKARYGGLVIEQDAKPPLRKLLEAVRVTSGKPKSDRARGSAIITRRNRVPVANCRLSEFGVQCSVF